MRRPTDCTGHSARTGLACRLSRVKGMTVCRRHGGSLTHVKAKAAQRLAAMVDPVLTSLQALALQRENLNAAFKASADLAGIGAKVEAIVRTSQKGEETDRRITVNIGFLQGPNDQPTTIVVPVRPEADEE
jgi:hypothetical protein